MLPLVTFNDVIFERFLLENVADDELSTVLVDLAKDVFTDPLARDELIVRTA